MRLSLPDNGNLGYPYTKQEITTFVGVLRKAGRRINDDEIKQLAKSLADLSEEKSR
ncbi:MAG: hypothetical protein V3T53_01770 [Phycisphaerales bacterium]